MTGKYTEESRPSGARGLRPIFSRENLRAFQPVLELMQQIGAAHGDKTPAQVALNWLMCQGNVLPIPGAKNAQQAAANAGAVGWSLTADEVAQLDEATQRWKK